MVVVVAVVIAVAVTGAEVEDIMEAEAIIEEEAMAGIVDTTTTHTVGDSHFSTTIATHTTTIMTIHTIII